MVFYFYIQPEVISVAKDAGPYAIQSLISLLRGDVQNCCVAEFEDYRKQQAIIETAATLDENFDRKIIKSLLATLQKRNRFIYVLKPDYTGVHNDVSIVLTSAETIPLDLLVLSHVDGQIHPQDSEVCDLATYQHTQFEAERSRIANEGLTLSEGEMLEGDFLDRGTGQNRDVSLSYKSSREVELLLKSYAAYKRLPITRF